MSSLAVSYGVPFADAALMAVNLYGIRSEHDRHRARVTIRLDQAPTVPWQVIVPLNAVNSPFELRADHLYLGRIRVGTVSRIDADEAVGGYFRDGGRAATVNPNARSRCVGCAFCPNTLEAAADPRLAEERDLDELLAALREQHPRNDLSELHEVTVSTGCFDREDAAVAHLLNLRKALTSHGIGARIGFLSSVITSDAAFATLARAAAPLVLRLTAECFTRRDLLLKRSKAQLAYAAMPDLLARAGAAGLDTSFTYIVGLDSLPQMQAGFTALCQHITAFPNVQVYQAHNQIMAGLRAHGADRLEFYLAARAALEPVLARTGLRPVAWENYRPLWHFTFDDTPLVAP
ncbi:hypothetical protein GCM10010123_20350 [Pilimelia anulata]|uniref:Radical SAM protein n=1 Tax=Pilimelia anulata TaxID=53371 RepID=A0A8J3BAE7_9ACTN|nr:hypothetical protein [Pilimelia anulata]GGJ90418.1 hypothetical protein GCM10010123_20350 [Pilimelia anulata]